MVSALLLLIAARSGAAQGAPAPATPSPTAAAKSGADGTENPLPLVAEKKWALCVGAGEYTRGLAPLRYAARDARAFAGALKGAYGFEPSTVSLLADGADAGAAPAARPPTSANILGELDRLLSDRRLDRGDLFVFYFSGHGVGTPTGDYLMPTDVPESEAATRGVPVREVVRRLVAAGLKNVLIVADACRSGAKNPFGSELQELGRRANIAILLGCAPGQRSYEAPELESGVFTHFLVRSMADRRLADETLGALWASALAKKVAKQVRSYTQADHPSDPQVPAVWSEPTQDVLLAAYPPSTDEAKTALSVVGGEFEAGRLDRERYSRYLSGMGRALREAGRGPEAIQALKTLDGLGIATWGDLVALGAALSDESREAEIGSLVARAAREPQPTDGSEYVVLLGQPSYVGTARYRRALAQVADAETYAFTGATLLVTVSRQRLRAGDAAIARDLAPYSALFAKDSPEGRYVAAHIALGERRYAEAAALAEAAGFAPERATERDELRTVRLKAAEGLKDDAKADAVIAEGEADPGASIPWAMTRLERMASRKDPGFRDAVLKFAATTDSDRRMTEALLLLGADAAELLPEAERLVAAHPYSWRAAVNEWLASSAATDLRDVPELSATALKYAPDRADLVRFALNRWDDLLEKARLAERVSGTEAARARGQLVGRYVGEWEAIQDEPVALMGLGRMFMRAGMGVRGAAFARRFLWPYARRQNYVRTELTATSLFLALNGGDEEIAREAFAALEREGGLAPRSVVRYVLHQALIGDASEAERAISTWPSLGRGEPDELVRGYFDFSRALLAARRGDRAEVERLTEGRVAGDRASAMLAHLAIYEAKSADGLPAKLAEAIIHPDPEFADLQLAAAVAVVRNYAGATTEDERLIRRRFSRYLAQEPGHPWVRAIGYDGAEGLPAFTGRTAWEGTFDNGRVAEGARLTLDAEATGTVRGTLVLAESNLTLDFLGKTDALGNLAGDLVYGGRTIYVLAMKLPATATVARMAAESEPAILREVSATLLKTAADGATLRLEPTTARASLSSGQRLRGRGRERVDSRGEGNERPSAPLEGTLPARIRDSWNGACPGVRSEERASFRCSSVTGIGSSRPTLWSRLRFAAGSPGVRSIAVP